MQSANRFFVVIDNVKRTKGNLSLLIAVSKKDERQVSSLDIVSVCKKKYDVNMDKQIFAPTPTRLESSRMAAPFFHSLYVSLGKSWNLFKNGIHDLSSHEISIEKSGICRK